MLTKYTSILGLLLLIGFNLKAEHLIGGKFSYKKLDASNIEFKLELERDCASSGASFETTVRVGLYANTTNKLVKTITYP